MPDDKSTQDPNSVVTGQPPPPPSVDNEYSPVSAQANSPANNYATQSQDDTPPVVVQGAGAPPSGPGSVQGITPPNEPRKINKKTVAAILGVLILIVGAVSGILLVQRQQDIRERAGSIGGNACTSPKGLTVTSVSTPGSAGDLGYRPIPQTYNVGETVNFRARIKNNSGNSVTDQYHFTTHKVTEAPTGQVPAPNLTEQQMYDIHYNQGTVQTPAYNSGNQSFTLAAGEEQYVSGSWTPTDCGYYQLDMGVMDFLNVTQDMCPAGTSPAGNAVVAAGFIKVVGCTATETVPPGGTPPPPDFPTPPGGTPPPPDFPTPPGGTPPPPPPGQAVCTDIRIYDSNDNQLTTNQLSSLSPGDEIKIAVYGATTAGSSFDKGRFSVVTNPAEKVSWTESTQSEDQNSYFYLYTIPTGVSTFTIKAQIHHTTAGWL